MAGLGHGRNIAIEKMELGQGQASVAESSRKVDAAGRCEHHSALPLPVGQVGQASGVAMQHGADAPQELNVVGILDDYKDLRPCGLRWPQKCGEGLGCPYQPCDWAGPFGIRHFFSRRADERKSLRRGETHDRLIAEGSHWATAFGLSVLAHLTATFQPTSAYNALSTVSAVSFAVWMFSAEAAAVWATSFWPSKYRAFRRAS